MAGAALPHPDRLAGQALAAAGLFDIQHQLQHAAGRQLPTKPIRRPRPIRHHTTRRKTPHTRLPLTPHTRHLHRTTMRSLPHPQQTIHTTSRHHTPTQPRIQTTHPIPVPPGTRLLRQRHRIHMMVVPTHHPRTRRVILLEIRRRRQHQHPITTQILTQRTRHPRIRVPPITRTPRINPRKRLQHHPTKLPNTGTTRTHHRPHIIQPRIHITTPTKRNHVGSRRPPAMGIERHTTSLPLRLGLPGHAHGHLFPRPLGNPADSDPDMGPVEFQDALHRHAQRTRGHLVGGDTERTHRNLDKHRPRPADHLHIVAHQEPPSMERKNSMHNKPAIVSANTGVSSSHS